MKMVTTIGLYGKRNDIISWRSFYVGLRLILNGNYCYMWCHHRSTLHQIYTSQIRNDNVRQVWKLSLVMIISTYFRVWWGKMWKISLYMWAPFFDAIATMVSQSVSWATVHSLPHGQHNKWIPKSSMVWPHWHH